MKKWLYSILLSIGMLSVFGTAQGAKTEEAIFAGGCFWCMQPPFDSLEGVVSTTAGYTGGHTINPTYEDVSNKETGHYEAIRVMYDPKVISYEELLKVFWRNVDPLDGGGQFCDRGTSYRSAIFYMDEAQKRAAVASEAGVYKELQAKIATKVMRASVFYPAEEYHQKYYKKNPLRYKYYKFACGREKRLKEVWVK